MASYKSLKTFLAKYTDTKRRNTIFDWYEFVKDEGYVLVDKNELFYLNEFKRKFLDGRSEKRCDSICPKTIFVPNGDTRCRRRKGHKGKHRIVIRIDKQLDKLAGELGIGKKIRTTSW